MTPNSTMAAFAMIAPCEVVMIASTAGTNSRWIARASGRSPASTASSIARYRDPATCPATLTHPLAPSANQARLSSSHPEYHARLVASISFVPAHWSPLASFTATKLGWRASSRIVSELKGIPVRPGMSYSMIGRCVASATARQCATRPRCVGLL